MRARVTDATPPPSLSLVVSAATLVAGAMGGSEVYTRQLLNRLSTDPSLTLRVISPSQDALARQPSSILVPTTGSPSSAGRLLSLVAMNLSLKARNAMQKADVIHYPLQVQSPLPPEAVNTVVTIHDVQHLDMPELFSRAERVYRQFVYDIPASRATAIITISEFSKRQIVDKLGVHPTRIHVAPLGHDVTGRPNLAGREDFILYPARAWPHKNHHRLIQAISILRTRRPALRLLLTGCSDSDFAGLPNWVTVLGNVPRRSLLQLYKSAACMAFPSLYEGFGLPLLEAMASGCPIAASRRAAIPELCQEAVAYFDPYDPIDIARGIDAALLEASAFAVAGAARSEAFSWEDCAKRHADIYRLSASGVRHTGRRG